MRLYLDDDSAEALLVALLEQAGHDVQIPADVGMIGQYDSIHLAHAVREIAPYCLATMTISKNCRSSGRNCWRSENC